MLNSWPDEYSTCGRALTLNLALKKGSEGAGAGAGEESAEGDGWMDGRTTPEVRIHYSTGMIQAVRPSSL